MSNCFPKSARLCKKSQFKRTAFGGIRTAGRFIILETLLNSKKQSRLGISCSRHYGNAVERNRFKRRLREIFRHARFSSALDIHVKPRSFAKTATLEQIRFEFQEICQRVSPVISQETL